MALLAADAPFKNDANCDQNDRRPLWPTWALTLSKFTPAPRAHMMWVCRKLYNGRCSIAASTLSVKDASKLIDDLKGRQNGAATPQPRR